MENTIKSQWGNNIEILKVDPKNQLVIFKEFSTKNQEIHIINNYFSKKNKQYFYSRNTEFGYIVNSEYMLNVITFDNIGNIIWGVVNKNKIEEEIKEVKIEFKNISDKHGFQVNSLIENNVFMIKPPDIYKSTEINNENWTIITKLYDENGTMIKSYHGF